MEREYCLQKKNLFKRWFTDSNYAAFIGALIAGLLTHAVIMIRQPVCADPVLFMDWYKSESWFLFNQGRWATNIFTVLRGYLVDPVLCTVITVFSMALSAAMAADLFGLKEKKWAALAGAAMAVHPYIANSLMYYSTDGTLLYAAAVLSVWLIYKSDFKAPIRIGLAGILQIFVLGASQGYICILTFLPVILFVLQILDRKVSGKEAKKNFLFCVISCIIGFAGYMLVWKYFIAKYEITTLYGGAEGYTLSSVITGLPNSLKRIYGEFFSYFFGESIVHNAYWARGIIYGITLMLSLAGLAITVVRNVVRKQVRLLDAVLCLCAVLVSPIAAISIDLVVANYNFYLMMANAFVFVIPMLCKLFEDCLEAGWMKRVYRAFGFAGCALLVWTYALSDIAGYLVLDQTSVQTKELATRVLYRLEETEGFSYDTPVCFIGQPNEVCYQHDPHLVEACPGSTFLQQGVFSGIWENSDGWGLYIYRYCGVKLNYYSNGMQNRIRELAETPEFESRGCYPAQDSVGIIDGVMVVKLGEYDASAPD